MNKCNLILKGSVVKYSGDKTIKVLVKYKRIHLKYKKILNISKFFLVHNEKNLVLNKGVLVWIRASRPISKSKKFLIYKILN